MFNLKLCCMRNIKTVLTLGVFTFISLIISSSCTEELQLINLEPSMFDSTELVSDSISYIISDKDSINDTDTMKFEQTSLTQGTILVANPGNNNDIKPNLEAAVNKAVDGNIILLPEGSFKFSGTLNIIKLVSLKGQGISKTLLYRPESISDASINYIPMIAFNINKDISCNIVVQGIYFKSKIPSLITGDGKSLTKDIGIQFKNAVDFVIRNCKFENFGNAGVLIIHKDQLARGLICENVFFHNYKAYDGQGYGYGIAVYGENKQWISNPNFGSSNFIFIESNSFEEHRHAIGGGGCGLYVCRYNTFKNHLLEAAIDMHEARGSGYNYYSTRAMEAYNNTITNTKFKNGSLISSDAYPWRVGNDLANGPFGLRGGEAIIHDNNISFCHYGVMVYSIYHSETGTSNTYPIAYQVGWTSGKAYGSTHTGVNSPQSNGDIFIWNNTFVDYHSRNTLMYISNSTMITKERDYHLLAKPSYTTYTYPHPLRSKTI